MELYQRMELFQGMINCKYVLFCWEYDAQWQVLKSSCPEQRFYDVLLTKNDYMPKIRESLENGCRALLAGADAGILWGIVPDRQSGHFYVIGPAMSVECSRKELNDLGQEIYETALRRIGHEWASTYPRMVAEHLQVLPTVPITEFCKDLAMLYYCVTLEEIHTSDVTYQIMQGTIHSAEESHRDRYRTWMAEQTLLGMVRNGDMNYKSALDQATTISKGVPIQGDGHLRQAKISGQTFVSLCTRAAIEGGLTPELAYTVGDSYIQQIENCRHLSDIPHITHTMYEEFIRRVHNQRRSPGISRKIQDCMDYIENHMGEKLTVAELAAHAGYSESSLSHKFKQETGISINAYIKSVRMARARLLLETTEDSVQDIAVRLGFYGRSHMARVFQQFVGAGPAEYRAKFRGQHHIEE